MLQDTDTTTERPLFNPFPFRYRCILQGRDAEQEK